MLPAGRFDRAVWMDYDHDYDLDLILLGRQPALLRNQGAAGWADRTEDFPFVKGDVTSVEKMRVVPDSKAFDLAVFYRDRAPVLYRDQLGGRYTVEAFSGQSRGESEASGCRLRRQPAGWTAHASMRTAAFISCAIRATKTVTGSVFSSKACEVSSWLRMRWSR